MEEEGIGKAEGQKSSLHVPLVNAFCTSFTHQKYKQTKCNSMKISHIITKNTIYMNTNHLLISILYVTVLSNIDICSGDWNNKQMKQKLEGAEMRFFFFYAALHV